MIDFMKSPVDQGLPLINVNGHPMNECMPYVLRIAKKLEADEMRIHFAQDGVHLDPSEWSIKITTHGGEIREGSLLKAGNKIARIEGLPINALIVERAKRFRG